jgi:hypothetical protein
LVVPWILKITIVCTLHSDVIVFSKNTSYFIVRTHDLFFSKTCSVVNYFTENCCVIISIEEVEVVDALVFGIHVLKIYKLTILDVLFILSGKLDFLIASIPIVECYMSLYLGIERELPITVGLIKDSSCLFETSQLLIRTPLVLDPTKFHRENPELLITCHPKVRLLFHVKVGVTEFLSLLNLSRSIALHE